MQSSYLPIKLDKMADHQAGILHFYVQVPSCHEFLNINSFLIYHKYKYNSV